MQIEIPEWVKHAIFYQIFPDRFARGDAPGKVGPQSHLLEGWLETPTSQGHKGGNLWGIIEKLDYLQNLGITAIYLNPVFQSASNHRYHTHNYYQIDPLLGGNDSFSKLLDSAHGRGIRIILDGVFNHASRGFFFFNDILENGSTSPWLDWFKVEKWPLSAYDYNYPANYISWKDNRALPQFNHLNPEVREYLMCVAEYWTRTGIDGWRLDEPRFIQAPGFWQEFRQRVKAINPEAYIVGEAIGDARQWLDGTQFDGVMNYLFATPTIRFTAGEKLQSQYLRGLDDQPFPPFEAPSYGEEISRLIELYPWDIQLTQLNLLGSHDTARILSVAGEDRRSVELAAVLLMTFPGAPCIYYGDEVGLPGGIDPDCRRAFPPDTQWDHDLLTCYRKLTRLRHDHPVLRTGRYQILLAQEDLYVFARILSDEEIIIALNVGAQGARAYVEPESDNYTYPLKLQPNTVLYGLGEATWERSSDSCVLELAIPSRSALILGHHKR